MFVCVTLELAWQSPRALQPGHWFWSSPTTAPVAASRMGMVKTGAKQVGAQQLRHPSPHPSGTSTCSGGLGKAVKLFVGLRYCMFVERIFRILIGGKSGKLSLMRSRPSGDNVCS